MKVQPREIDRFLKSPPPAVRAVLFYGPDGGLVRERATAMARLVVADLNDPFLVTELTGDQLKDDPARLADEAAAMAMIGGRRVVRLRDIGEGQAKLLDSFLTDNPGDAMVVIAAGELKGTGALVKAFEKAENAAAIACYGDEGRALDTLLMDRLNQDGVRIDSDAAQYVLSHLGSDRAISRMEIEKLALYAGRGGRISLEDAMALVGDSAALALDDAAYAVGDGDARALDRAMASAFEAGTSPVGLLRAVGSHLMRLHRGASEVAGGGQAQAVAKSLVRFWKLQDRFTRQISAWQPNQARDALTIVMEAEAACKRSGIPDIAMSGRALHSAAAIGRQALRRKAGR